MRLQIVSYPHYSSLIIECLYKYFLVFLLFFVDLYGQKATEGTELQLQSHIQALLYIYNTDYMMSLITVHILHAP